MKISLKFSAQKGKIAFQILKLDMSGKDIKERPKRLVAFETFDQSDKMSWQWQRHQENVLKEQPWWPWDDRPVQPALSWRASSDRQISLSASAERVFANFRVKNVVLQVYIFVLCFQWRESARLQIFVAKTSFFTSTHFCAKTSFFYKYTFLCFHRWETLPAGWAGFSRE